MKRFLTIFAFVVALLVWTDSRGPMIAQQSTTQQTIHSTLTTNLTDTNLRTVVVGSTTGMSASTNSAQTFVLIDHELMRVTAVVSTTVLTVVRAAGGTASPHNSGAVVIYGPGGGNFNTSNGNASGVFLSNVSAPPAGRCTASNSQYLPVIVYGGGQWSAYNCNNSQWVRQTIADDLAPTLTRYCTPPYLAAVGVLTTNGDANAPFVVGNNTTPVAGSVFYGTIEIPKTMRLTGISILNGTVAGTDDLYFGLYRADGVRVAYTLLAGTVASGIGRFQDIAFTTPYLATGPARYWISYTSEGTTTRFRTVNLTPGSSTAGLGAFTGLLGSSFVNTAPAMPDLAASVAASNPTTGALPTSLIANVAPIGCVY